MEGTVVSGRPGLANGWVTCRLGNEPCQADACNLIFVGTMDQDRKVVVKARPSKLLGLMTYVTYVCLLCHMLIFLRLVSAITPMFSMFPDLRYQFSLTGICQSENPLSCPLITDAGCLCVLKAWVLVLQLWQIFRKTSGFAADFWSKHFGPRCFSCDLKSRRSRTTSQPCLPVEPGRAGLQPWCA